MQQFSSVDPIFDGLTRKNGVNQSGLQDMIDRINKNADLNAYFVPAVSNENAGADAQLTSLQRRTMTGPESLILQVEEQGRKLGKTGGALQDYIVENGTGLLSRNTVGYWEKYSKGLEIRFGLKAGEADSIRKQLAYAYSDPGGVVDWDLVRLPEGGEQVTLSYLDHRVVRTRGFSAVAPRDAAGQKVPPSQRIGTTRRSHAV